MFFALTCSNLPTTCSTVDLYQSKMYMQKTRLIRLYKSSRTGVDPITQYTHVRNKNSNTQGGKSDFLYLKELLLKEKIRTLLGQILSLKRSYHFEKGRNYRESLLDTVIFVG